jgi:hypothetical protein
MISAKAADDRIADCTTSTPKTQPNATTNLTTGYIADTEPTEKTELTFLKKILLFFSVFSVGSVANPPLKI